MIFRILRCLYLISDIGMLVENSDLLKVTILKVEQNSLSTPFWNIKSEVASFYLFIFASLLFFFLLSDSKSKELVVLYLKTYFEFRSWQYAKAISILQALICLVKLLVDLTTFLQLGHIYNLDSIAIITNVCRIDYLITLFIWTTTTV